MEKKVLNYLNRINKKVIETYNYVLYGWEEGYEEVPTRNIGYLPFPLKKEVKTTIDILSDDSPLKANEMRKSTNYITLHNTGMAHPTATAKGLNEYIHTTTRIASWHFSIDDKEAYQELKLGEVGWHAGDGSLVYGDTYFNKTYNSLCIGGGNRCSVGIEMCVYSGCDFNNVMRNTAKLVSKLLKKYNLTPSSVRQHNDFSGKNCPQVLRESNRWKEMLELIELEYIKRMELNDYQFTFKSLDKDIMNDDGVVINNPKIDKVIHYEVKVKNKVTKKINTYRFESLLKGI